MHYVGSLLLLIVGPLNYLGVNPKISCKHLPQPST
jgi:hypothetical protein